VVCDQWQVVAVPFPFSGKGGARRRPALAVSKKEFNRSGHTIFAMITSTGHHPWPGDTLLHDPAAAGLQTGLVRLKLFMLDNRLILRTLGRLSPGDLKSVMEHIRACLF
jgi:mRNA-degrading endonuclease toxin of MazEF toxin-antitoxin module